MTEGFTLRCPIRGDLKVSGRSADGLSPLEEKYRVEALQHLLDHGFPKENFVVEPVIKRFGHQGRNSFRADFAILDVPHEGGRDEEWLLEHALVLGEVKRDSSSARSATEYQVKPLLAFAHNSACVAVYWDNVNQMVFWREWEGGQAKTYEGPIEALSRFGQPPGAQPLTLGDLRTDAPLRDIFERIEDILHSASVPPSRRFQLMMQLLLAKIYDEAASQANPGVPPRIQDYRSLRVSHSAARATFKAVALEAIEYYKNHLPEKVSSDFDVPNETFFSIMSVLAPHRVTSASHTVVQDFYMYFAKGLYKWDLAQYFTPPAVTDFIVQIVAPEWNQNVLDPACGSADFLTAAYRRGVDAGFASYADKIWGNDVSPEAVQVSVLNMVLNGDGKSNIKPVDSLTLVGKEEGKWDVLICNPPFGTRILERDPDKLRKFDLGSIGYIRPTGRQREAVMKAQETGILFAELCVRLARPGTGRVALVVPNGYLGNVSGRYVEARRWLLRHAKVAAIVGLPRFTFKGSGADVSASIIFLEKREVPLAEVPQSEEYSVSVQLIDNVGWSTGDKKAAPTYLRDPEDGTLVLDDTQSPIVLSDFGRALDDIRNSAAARDFRWLAREAGSSAESTGQGLSVPISTVLQDPYLTLDPKRLSRKRAQVIDRIMSVEHFRLGDVVDVIPELRDSKGRIVVLDHRAPYNYVELQNVECGSYRSVLLRGWQLPARAKHLAEPGDFYVGAVWGSVRKWMLIGRSDTDIVVTNGMHRLRLKQDMDHLVTDLVAGLCTEAYAVQMRAAARGSDGLAEVRPEDLAEIVLPRLTDAAARVQLHPFVNQLLTGITGVEAAVRSLVGEGLWPGPDVPPRDSHVHLV